MEDWAKLKVVDLKAELKRRELNVNGLKADLVERLQTDDAARADGAHTGEDSRIEGAAIGGQDSLSDAAVNATSQYEMKEIASPSTIESAPQPTHNSTATQEKVEQEAPQGITEPSRLLHPERAPTEPIPVGEPSTIDHDLKPSTTASAAAQTPEQATATTGAGESLPSPDSQKRKRRSQSPPPVEEEVARKRARADGDAGPRNGIATDPETEIMSDAPPPQSPPQELRRRESPAREPFRAVPQDRRDQDMDIERDVAPALHPATSALYINNLMRPLRPVDLRTHLASLASSNASPDDVITTFFLDQIRTHALVIFDSTTSASRVRTAMHDRVWPEESNRKALSVDFVPPEKVAGWIETEEGAGRGGRSGSRWEVVYETLPDGTVEVHLESGAVSSTRSGPPPSHRGPLPPSGSTPYEGPNAVPLGPRGFRDDHNAPPTGPRSSREQSQRDRPAPPGSITTRSRPTISYQPVPPSLAKRRIESLQSHYTRDTRRYLGREINRYYFEDGDKFVDRGKEVFEGIRPPHKERGGGFRGRGGGGRRSGGGGGGRGRGRGGDRYMPPGRGRLAEDEGRLPRYTDDRQ